MLISVKLHEKLKKKTIAQKNNWICYDSRFCWYGWKTMEQFKISFKGDLKKFTISSRDTNCSDPKSNLINWTWRKFLVLIERMGGRKLKFWGKTDHLQNWLRNILLVFLKLAILKWRLKQFLSNLLDDDQGTLTPVYKDAKLEDSSLNQFKKNSRSNWKRKRTPRKESHI